MPFDNLQNELLPAIDKWENVFLSLKDEQITVPKNDQNRSIKQIVGHMIDSASNNTHRVIHLQYGEQPLNFPNYATYGNNDRWIAIQNYQEEAWKNLVQLWKYTHLHFLHVVKNIDPKHLQNKWLSDKDCLVSLEEMVIDFPRHFQLHLSEINQLINS